MFPFINIFSGVAFIPNFMRCFEVKIDCSFLGGFGDGGGGKERKGGRGGLFMGEKAISLEVFALVCTTFS